MKVWRVYTGWTGNGSIHHIVLAETSSQACAMLEASPDTRAGYHKDKGWPRFTEGYPKAEEVILHAGVELEGQDL